MELGPGEVFSPPSTSTLPLVIPTHHASSHRLTIRSSRCYRQSHPRKNIASPNPPRSITTPGAPSKHDRVHISPRLPLSWATKSGNTLRSSPGFSRRSKINTGGTIQAPENRGAVLARPSRIQFRSQSPETNSVSRLRPQLQHQR